MAGVGLPYTAGVSFLPLYFFGFGVFSLAGGIIGFAKAKSTPSLIAGGISGALLGAAGWFAQSGRPVLGFVLGGLVSLALVGRFGPAYRKQRKLFPAGVMAILGLGGMIVAAVGLAR